MAAGSGRLPPCGKRSSPNGAVGNSLLVSHGLAKIGNSATSTEIEDLVGRFEKLLLGLRLVARHTEAADGLSRHPR